MPLQEIVTQQKRWARKKWPGHIGMRAPTLTDNLICPMSADVRTEYKQGGGNELGTPDRPGKMYSLRSSSALAYNFFAPWREHNLTALSAALGTPIQGNTLRFEYKFQHGLHSEPPNLDVALEVDQVHPVGIECKFTEPYGHKAHFTLLKAKYFTGNRRRWAELGLRHCQILAETLGKEVEFRRLDAGQLLKHILGLAWTSKQAPRLIYLWFDTMCDESLELKAELSRFSSYLDAKVEFRIVSYQFAFDLLKNYPEPCSGYFEYLSERYFSV